MASSGDNVMSVQDSQFDVEMDSNHEQPEQHSEDSLLESGSEGSNHPCGESDMESDQDRASDHHSDSSSSHNSDPGLNL